ncbi:MAG: tetratricopeptide repeat protein, partial [Ignavibacteriota bacterium]
PVELERVPLPSSFEYPLAGIQHVKLADFDAIIRAHKFGVAKIVARDTRKSVMVLPFEDLSPAGDNEWFSNGIVAELVGSLSNVKALRVIDRQTTKEFKHYKGQLSDYASEMSIRYFIQGSVQKFGDQIKVNSSLLDIETGDHLWQESMKGTMDDVFEIQEKVVEKIVEGLKIHLTSDEKDKLAERGTENTEAYELYLRAIEYFLHHTKQGYEVAIQLDTEAIRLDPRYANPYQHKANALTVLYTYDHQPEFLVQAESLCEDAMQLQPDLSAVYAPLSKVYMFQGKLEQAEEVAREYIRKAPEDLMSHFSLALFFDRTGQPSKAIPLYEESLRLQPDHRTILFNLVNNCNAAGDLEKSKLWALVALPIQARHLKLHPDDETSREFYTFFLRSAGHTEEARREARLLKHAKDRAVLYNMACAFSDFGDYNDAFETLQRAMKAGYGNIQHLNNFLTEHPGIAALADTPEYIETKKMLDEIVARHNSQTTNG